MTSEEIFRKLKGATCEPDDDRVAELVQEALAIGIPALEIIAQAIVPPYWTCPELIDFAAATASEYGRYE